MTIRATREQFADWEAIFAASIFEWANRTFGTDGWSAVGTASFFRPNSYGCSIERRAALIEGKAAELGDDVEAVFDSTVLRGTISDLFEHRNDIPNNNWWNYKMVVWSDGRAQTFMSYDVFDGEDPRLWADESEFTFGPFEEEPVLRR